MRIAVIGLGAVGSAALRYVASRGHQAVGFEQFERGHTRGSSHGESRIIRYAYPDPFYTHLMSLAYPLWDQLEEAAQQTLFVRRGMFFFGKSENPELRAIEEALTQNQVPYERWSASQAQERYPAMRFQPGEQVIYHQEGGYLRATACVFANLRLAEAAGAVIREHTPVLSLESQAGGVLIRLAAGEEWFDRVLVSAGAWLSSLLPLVNLPLSVTRQSVFYLNIANQARLFEADALPVWIDADTYWYGFPADGVVPGVKLARHQRGEPISDLSQPARPLDESDWQPAIAYASQRFPDLSDELTEGYTCLYTNAPNDDFLLDRAPELPHVHLVSACSGHGFKFSVLMGQLAAQETIAEPVGLDLSRFRLGTQR